MGLILLEMRMVMNAVDMMGLSDLVKLRMAIEQVIEDRKDDYTKKR